jgi:hypothetical protein
VDKPLITEHARIAENRHPNFFVAKRDEFRL